MRLVVGFHTKRCHVFLRTGLGQRRQDGYALRQADDLLVQLPGFFIGPGSRTPARTTSSTQGRVVEFEAGDAILTGRVEDKPVLLPFLMGAKEGMLLWQN